MRAFVLFCLLGQAFAQPRECVFTVPNGPDAPPYVLNLTSVSYYTLELEVPEIGFNYYYTPCGNRLQCQQGNAQYATNLAQYKPGVNGCVYYLAVDHHQQPAYSHIAASFIFHYDDGEFCEQLQQPRRSTIYWTCAEDGPLAYMTRVQEVTQCNYHITIESSLACVPENARNENCQYRVPINNGSETASLNLAPLKEIDPLKFIGHNGYRFYYSPCQNSLYCHQQTGQMPVMSILENSVTSTCERYISVWENGLHLPIYHEGTDDDNEYFEFRYYNGQPCNGGSYGSEERITYICDESEDTAKTINVTEISHCRIDYFVATKLACQSSYGKSGKLLV